MKNSKKATTAKDWLEMDLKGQSGAIWTNEKKVENKKKYVTQKFSGMILKPDPVKYGGKQISENSQIID